MTTTSAAQVSRTLVAKFIRSESHGTRVRGYRSSSKGFTASQSGTTVVVNYETGSGVRHRGDKEERISCLARYAAHLEANGYTAVIEARNGESADHRRLRVTKA